MKYKILFISIFLAIHHSHAAEVDLVGSLEGGTNIDSNGVVEHSIPINIPPSLNSFIPQLAISYSGQSGDGVLGVGWAIDGLSSISRCNELNGNNISTPPGADSLEKGSNFFGTNIPPNINYSCFALDGKKLILINSSEPIEKAQFRLENDNFTKVTLEIDKDSAGNYKGIKKFLVKQKDGLIKEYAAALKTNSKDTTKPGEYTVGYIDYTNEWGLSSVRDLNGNYWSVEYQDLNKGILYPKTINYTGNDGGNPISPQNIIYFEYISRNPDEIKIGYSDSASNIVLDKKISKIIIKNNGSIKSEYRFQYEEITDKIANKTRLKNIDYCIFEGGNHSCSSPTKIEWTSYGKSVMTTPYRTNLVKVPNINSSTKLNTIQLNIKKDSLVKQNVYVAKIDNNLKLYSYSPSVIDSTLDVTLSHPSLSNFQEWSPITLDVNGDGVQDLVIYGRDANQQVSLLLFTSIFDSEKKRQFSFYKELKNIFSSPAPLINILTIDGDRDGIEDLALLSGDKNDIRFNGIKLDSQGNLVSVKSTIIGDNIKYALNNTSSGRRNISLAEHILSGNFTRDKTNDIVFYHINSSGLNFCKATVYKDVIQNSQNISNCDFSNEVSIKGDAAQVYKDYDFSVVDFNRDGLDDIVMSKVIRLDPQDGTNTRFQERLVPLLSTGFSFEPQPAIDLPVYTINTEQAWEVNTNWEDQFSVPIFSDFNHDGFIDFYRYVNTFDRSGGDGKVRYKADIISYLQRPNRKFEIYQRNVAKWWMPRNEQESFNFSLSNFPSDLPTDKYKIQSASYLSDVNNNGFEEINLQFIARPFSGNDIYIYSLMSQASAEDIITDLPIIYILNQLQYPNIDFQDMLKSVESGDGHKQLFSYSNFRQAPESMELRPFPIRGSSAPILVTQSVENYLNNVLGSKTNYTYSSPRVDVKDNRFLGFETTTETLESYNKNANGSDVTDKLVKETVFNQNYPFIGMAKSVVTKANDALVSKLTIADADFVSDSAYPTTKVKFPRIKKSTVENYELGTLVSKTVTANNYENVFGNLTDSTVTTSSADG
ncbi:SpvB/TcaC N-terminal domain-containing protein, partial [Acinetobacter oleivorans]|uniref:SpvB/TcaC N-terminal domain-containing protein n=1 Tax=Acinetobacter oleivorans TaxID=1148157 RepID=UPI00226CDED1